MPSLRLVALAAAGLVAVATAWAAPAPKTAPAARASRPAAAPRASGSAADPVLARLPWKTIRRSEFLDSWARLDPQYRPPGTGTEAKKAFLDQLVQKELLAHAALADSFTLAPLESVQIAAEQRDLLRRAVIQRLVTDSAIVTPADLDSARHRTAAGLPAAQVRGVAMQFAQRRRAAIVDARIRTELAPAWDDSVATMLLRAYAKLDPKLPDASKPLSLSLPSRMAVLAASDTGRVLARTNQGPFTAIEFARRFMSLDPFRTPLPATVADIQNMGSFLLGQMWLDQQTEREAYRSDPAVRTAIQQRKESVALDHYYARHVTARVDTSDAVLRARYQQTPDAYAVPAHWIVTRQSYRNQAAADSAQAALARGAAWDSICAHAYVPGDARRNDCADELALPDPYPDTIFATVLQGLKPGESSVLPMPETRPGDERRLLVRLVRHDERKFQPFEAARGYVLRDVQQAGAEAVLDREIARLKAATPVTIDAKALAATDLAAWARQVGGPPRRGGAPPGATR